MKILGIDPGLTKVGWGLIHIYASKVIYLDSGIIKTDVSESIPLRLAGIYDTLEKVIQQFSPNKVAMEESFVNINAQSSLKLAYARGAIMSLIGKYNLEYYEYLPNKVKKATVGVGHADKNQVSHMMKRILSNMPLEKKMTLDESDALAVAYSCSVYN